MNNFLFFPTMRCNLKCSYCHFKVDLQDGAYTWAGYGKEHVIEKEVSAEEMILFLSPFAPYHVEMTGGEPTIWRDFKKFVSMIPHGSTWAVTSNTLGNVAEIDFSKCKSWTASWHGVNFDKFMDNVKSIKGRYPFISVSIVIQKEKFLEGLNSVFLFASQGIRPNVLRELNPGVDWRGTKEWELLSNIKKCGVNVVEEDIPPSFDFEKGYACEGGVSYFAVMPDGTLYRCYSDAMRNQPIGTIHGFERETELYECKKECLGCAMDHKARRKKIDVV